MRWFLIIYFVIWAALVIISKRHIRLQEGATAKKRMADRWAIFAGVFVAVFMSLGAILIRQYQYIPMSLTMCALIVYLNLRYTFFCTRCGSRSQIITSRTSYCAACGHRIN